MTATTSRGENRRKGNERREESYDHLLVTISPSSFSPSLSGAHVSSETRDKRLLSLAGSEQRGFITIAGVAMIYLPELLNISTLSPLSCLCLCTWLLLFCHFSSSPGASSAPHGPGKWGEAGECLVLAACTMRVRQ